MLYLLTPFVIVKKNVLFCGKCGIILEKKT